MSHRLDVLDLNSTAVQITYTNTSSTVDTYKWVSSDGLLLKTLTITYTDSTKSQISSVVRS